MSKSICSVMTCPEPVVARGWCSSHYARWKRTGDIRAEIPIGMVRYDGEHSSKWVEVPNYLSMHERVVKVRGTAKHHPCAHCGEKADQWAYDKTDPDERVQKKGRKHELGLVYSLSTQHYLPLCVPCHKKFDRRKQCKRGHPLSGDNLYIDSQGTRQCRECRVMRDRRWRANQKGKAKQ